MSKTCVTHTCTCSLDCSCPAHEPDRHPITNCCQCNAILPPSAFGTGPCGGATPHDVNTRLDLLDAPYNKGCGCECDEGQSDKNGEGQYEYTTIDEPVLDADGNQVGTRTVKIGVQWVDGECPEGTPDFVDCKCICEYDEDPTLCPQYPDEQPNDDPDICECECVLTNADCISRDPTTPVADTGSCTCVCDKPPCPADEPDFDSSDCSCYCSHVRNDDCPADKPEVDGQCECYCPVTSCPSGETLNTAICECEPCPNSCNGCEVQDADCNCTGCAGCDETEFCFKADPSDTEDTCICCGPGLQECGGSCVDTSCPVGKTWNWADCACECSDPNKVICNGTCKDPCPEGESFDADCVCVPDHYYAQSFLDRTLLP